MFILEWCTAINAFLLRVFVLFLVIIYLFDLWDFNHADLKSVFPKIHQHVDFPTREKNTLDFVYTSQRGAYKALPLPHLGASDHITVMLMPAYRPLVKAIKPVHKQIQVWPEGSSEALQDCFNTTDWDIFKQAATYNSTTDLQEYTETVTAYITKCIDDVTVTKTITVRANQKPWLTGEVYRLLFCYQQFFYFIFSHTTQHNIQNTTKQNSRHILNISRSNQKGGGEGRTTRTPKLLLYIITYIQQKTLPSINGRRPGPTNSRRCTFT